MLGPLIVKAARLSACAAALAAACVVAGCAQHARVICEPLELAYEGDMPAAVAALDETGLADSGRDRFLYHAQRGHLLHLANDYQESNREFEAAVAAAEELEPWSVSETLTDYTLNEAVKAYAGEDYERAYLHYYMALNYLEMDDLEDALVECRRLDEVFRELDARYEDDGRYQDDGFIRYLSGLIYEAMGMRDDARIDFELAVEAYAGGRGGETGVPVPEGLEASLGRLEDPWAPVLEVEGTDPAPGDSTRAGGASVGPGEALTRSVHPIPPPRGRYDAPPETEIVVIIDSGWAPYKQETSVEVPIHRALVPEELRGRTNLAALVKVAYPELVSPPYRGVDFRASVSDSTCGNPRGVSTAEPVQDIDALARWTLERRKPALILRSTLRATAKQVALARAKHEAEEKRDEDSDERPFASIDGKGGFWRTLFGWIFEDLATHAVAHTEQADTRSWVMLPSEILMARVAVEPGEYTVCVQAGDGSPPVSLGLVSVEPGKKVFRSARFFEGPHPVRCDARRRR